MPSNNSSFRRDALPSEFRDSVIMGKKYKPTVLTDQLLGDLDTTLDILENQYMDYIDSFKSLGGRIESAQGNGIKLSLGNSFIIVYYGDNGYPNGNVIYKFNFAEPEICDSEINAINNAYMAIVYSDAIPDAKAKIEMSRKDLVNLSNIDGFQEKAKIINDDRNAIIMTMNGAKVSKKKV